MRRAKRSKGSTGQRVKPPTLTRAVDALIGYEEQNGKYTEEKKKRDIGSGTPSQLPWTI